MFNRFLVLVKLVIDKTDNLLASLSESITLLICKHVKVRL